MLNNFLNIFFKICENNGYGSYSVSLLGWSFWLDTGHIKFQLRTQISLTTCLREENQIRWTLGLPHITAWEEFPGDRAGNKSLNRVWWSPWIKETDLGFGKITAARISGFKTNEGGTSLVAQRLKIRLPMQGTQAQTLVWEDPTCHGEAKPVSHNYWACTLEPASHNYWACSPRAHAPQQEKLPQREAHAPQRRVAPARRN